MTEKKSTSSTPPALSAKRSPQAKEFHDYAEDIVETMREPLLVLNAELRVKTANRPFYQTFQASPEETENQLIYDLGAGQWDIPRLRMLLEEILPENSSFEDFEVEHTFPAIGRRIMLLNARQIHSAEPRVGLILLAIEDVTERKQAEEVRSQLLARERVARSKAESAEQRSAFLAEASKVLSSSLDYETTLRSVARLAVPTIADWCVVDMLEPDGSLRRLAVAHADPAKVELAWELERRYPPGPDIRYGALHVVRTRRSEIYPDIPDSLLAEVAQGPEHLKILRELGLRSYMTVPLVARERVLGAITFVTAESEAHYGPSDLALAEDLAHRASIAIDNARLYREVQEAQKAAEEANRAKDEFVAMVSHELRTPLTAMLGWTRMLRAGRVSAADATRGLEAIERNAQAQTRLVEDLLDVSRIISGKLRLDVRSVELASIIEAAVDSVLPAAEAKGIRLQTVLDPRAGPICGDPDRLQQVVWNLLSNAIKFTGKGGRVHVQLMRINSHAEITVSDTGKGISADFLPYVFDRFRQADPSSIRRHGGLGLGLAIVRHLVELHGGTVHAQSPGEGQGSKFTVRLPLVPVQMEASDPRRVHPTVSRGVPFECPTILHGLKVLVVDDERDAREFLTLALERCGAQVTAVSSAAEALRVLEGSEPDVLISDIGMPDEDGYDLIRQVRARPPERGGRIPAVALTAYARLEDRMRVLSAGYQIHVPKPVEPAELATVVASVAGWTGKNTGHSP